MLTFEQALLMVKCGEDMRWHSWPARQFVRLRAAELVRVTPAGRIPYTPTQAEMLGAQWSKA